MTLDPFNPSPLPPKEAVVHPRFIPTKREVQMPCLVSLGYRESVHDELIDQIKEELARATTIIRVGVVDGSGSGGDGEAVDMNIVVDVARRAVEGLADKRRYDDGGGDGVGGYTPQSGSGGQTTDIPYRLGRYFSVGAGSSKVYSCASECSTCRLKMEGLINKVEELLQAQKDTNSAIKSLMSKRGVQPTKTLSSPYTPIKVMTNMHEWWEDWYLGLSDESTNMGAMPYDQRLALFRWDDDGLAFSRGSVPYPGGCEWIGAKRIIAVMNINDNYFVTIEIIIEEGIINAYDCNIPYNEDSAFFCHMQPLLDLFPKLLKQSGMFSHLPEKLLNESWKYDRKKDIPRNETNKACASWSLAFVEALLTRTNMTKPDALLSDNTVEKMQWRWA